MSYPPQRYMSDTGDVSATFRAVDTTPEVAIGARTQIGYLATGATTEGHFGLYRWDLAATKPSDSLPDGHFHRTFAESFFILAGSVSLYNGAKWIEATSGDFLYVPPGGIHSFTNRSGAAASLLILFTPGAPREAFFEEIASIVATG